MANAKNKVIAGYYQGHVIHGGFGTIFIDGNPTVNLDKYNVRNFELVDSSSQKSMSSGLARGLVGGALLGPVGMIAGGATAKNKGIYTVAIEFRDGNRSLIEIDDKLYKILLKTCF